MRVAIRTLKMIWKPLSMILGCVFGFVNIGAFLSLKGLMLVKIMVVYACFTVYIFGLQVIISVQAAYGFMSQSRLLISTLLLAGHIYTCDIKWGRGAYVAMLCVRYVHLG